MKDFIVQPILTASTIDWVRFINIDQVLNYDTLRYENAYLSLYYPTQFIICRRKSKQYDPSEERYRPQAWRTKCITDGLAGG